jgi:hypothetical protein
MKSEKILNKREMMVFSGGAKPDRPAVRPGRTPKHPILFAMFVYVVARDYFNS